jgi:hypothetical protein
LILTRLDELLGTEPHVAHHIHEPVKEPAYAIVSAVGARVREVRPDLPLDRGIQEIEQRRRLPAFESHADGLNAFLRHHVQYLRPG